MDNALNKRNQEKKKKPNFVRQDHHKNKKLDKNWRRPRGIDSNLRLGERGSGKKVKVGYGSPKSVKGLTRNGYEEVLIQNVKDIENINDIKKQIGVVGSNVGNRKKVEILNKAQEKGVMMSNYSKEFVSKIEEELKKRKEERKKREDKKKQKEKAAKQKKEGKQSEGSSSENSSQGEGTQSEGKQSEKSTSESSTQKKEETKDQESNKEQSNSTKDSQSTQNKGGENLKKNSQPKNSEGENKTQKKESQNKKGNEK